MTTDLEAQLRSELAQVADLTPIPPPQWALDAAVPAGAGARRAVLRARRSSRFRWTAAAVVTAAALAVPVAAAAGVLSPVAVAFGWTHTTNQFTDIRALDRTAKLVLTTVGPEGEPMQLYAAVDRSGGQCTSLLMKDRAGAQQLVDASCETGIGQRESKSLGIDFKSSGGATGSFEIIQAPGAATLTLFDGTSARHLPVAHGLSAVWLPPGDAHRPQTFTSRNAKGALVKRVTYAGMYP